MLLHFLLLQDDDVPEVPLEELLDDLAALTGGVVVGAVVGGERGEDGDGDHQMME